MLVMMNATKLLIFCQLLLLFVNQNVFGQKCTFLLKPEFLKSGYTCKIVSSYSRDMESHATDKNDDDVKNIESNGMSIHDEFKNLNLSFCQKFNNLENVLFTSSKIVTLDKNLLQKCTNLKGLDFQNNNIKSIPEPLLSRSTNLEFLNLKNNELKTLPEFVFLNQLKLIWLGLNGNDITTLPGNVFKPLINLKELSLRINKIQDINPEWFKNLQKLRRLELNYNQISDIPAEAFESLINLETLYLSNNQITILRNNCFKNLKNLKSLDLSHNQISDITMNILDPMKSLEMLWMSNNKLKMIHKDSFKFQEKLIIASFANNSINAIDESFIDNTLISNLDMNNNQCCDRWIPTRDHMKMFLERCFHNYNPYRKQETNIITTTQQTTTTQFIINPRTNRWRLRTTTRPNTEEGIIYYPTARPQKMSKIFEASQSNTQVGNKLKFSQSIPLNDDPDTCGIRKIRTRVIGGIRAPEGAYPWNVALTTSDGIFFCGGILLDNIYVLTVAHCIIGKKRRYIFAAKDIITVIGAHNMTKFERHQLKVRVKSIRVHPDWNTKIDSYDADIAILELANPVEYTDYIQPICLIEPNSQILSITNGVSVGFGKSINNEFESIAQVIETPIQSNEKCVENKLHETLSSHRAFCGGKADGTGVCTGDSGSGLYVTYNQRFYLRGMVSASLTGGVHGCNVNQFTIFTDVVKFYSWIKSGGVYDAETKVQKLESEIGNLHVQIGQRGVSG